MFCRTRKGPIDRELASDPADRRILQPSTRLTGITRLLREPRQVVGFPRRIGPHGKRLRPSASISKKLNKPAQLKEIKEKEEKEAIEEKEESRSLSNRNSAEPLSRTGSVTHLDHPRHVHMPDEPSSSRSAIAGLLIVIASIGGLVLLGWLSVVLLDLKHLNTSGFTLP